MEAGPGQDKHKDKGEDEGSGNDFNRDILIQQGGSGGGGLLDDLLVDDGPGPAVSTAAAGRREPVGPRTPPRVTARVADPERRPARRSPRRKWLMAAGVLAAVALLAAGAALPVWYLSRLYDGTWSPGDLSRAVKQDRLRTHLTRYASGDADAQQRARQAIERIDPGNVNMRYYRLVKDLQSPARPNDWDEEVRAVESMYDSLGGHSKDGNAFQPLFRREELDLLKVYARRWDAAGPQAGGAMGL